MFKRDEQSLQRDEESRQNRAYSVDAAMSKRSAALCTALNDYKSDQKSSHAKYVADLNSADEKYIRAVNLAEKELAETLERISSQRNVVHPNLVKRSPDYVMKSKEEDDWTEKQLKYLSDNYQRK